MKELDAKTSEPCNVPVDYEVSSTDTADDSVPCEPVKGVVEPINDQFDKEVEAETTLAESEPNEPKQSIIETIYTRNRSAIKARLSDLTQAVEDGSVQYELVDFDSSFVYAIKISVTESGESESLFIRIPYQFNDENEALFNADSHEIVVCKWLTPAEDAQYALLQKEHETLLAYKTEREEKDRIAEYTLVLAKFDDLADEEEFKSIANRMLEFETAEALERECFVLRGKKAAPKQSLRQVVDAEQASEKKPYNGFIEKYTKK